MATEIIQADGPEVALDTPVAGNTTITFQVITYTPGSGDLLVFHNGSALVPTQDYTENSTTSIILLFNPDDIGPDIDTFEFITLNLGASEFLATPTIFKQLDPPKRPNNFGGRFVNP